MTPLRQRMIDDLTIRNYSPKTIQSYVTQVRLFAEYFGTSPERLDSEDVRRYQLHLIEERRLSCSAVNIAVCALRFFYGTTLGRSEMVERISYGKRPQTLPVVLSHPCRKRLPPSFSAGSCCIIVWLANVFRFGQGR